MNIFIDESGSFVNATSPGSWNSVAAYMSPENDRRYVRKIVGQLKRKLGVAINSEVKLKNLSEADYFNFLKQLGKLDGVLYAIATDAGMNNQAVIAQHQKHQAENILKHKEKMLYESARSGLQDLANRMAALSPQLYVQLQCQISLIADIVLNGILYFAQRRPNCLGHFRWRIDQKNSTRTEYENVFVSVTPAFLQTISLSEPMPMLIGADYSAFSRFDYSYEERPKYLKETYGLAVDENQPVTNIGMLIKENLEFANSEHNLGVQVADLMASGIRRCLRQEFSDNELAARLLGRLMVQGYRSRLPLQFRSFLKAEERMAEPVARLSKIMKHHCRPMLLG